MALRQHMKDLLSSAAFFPPENPGVGDFIVVRARQESTVRHDLGQIIGENGDTILFDGFDKTIVLLKGASTHQPDGTVYEL